MAMRSVDVVEAEAGKGLIGDRYHGTKHRHVTIQSAEDLAAAGALHGSEIDPSSTRRNLTISHGPVPSRPGDRLRVGDLEMEVVRIAAPCKLLDDVIGRGAKTALRRRAGSVCRLLSSGTISLGDTFTFDDTRPGT
jgi:MOSC domain-containing protein YiiM